MTAEPIVETQYGRVRGAEHDGVYTFLGMPYGAPTGGANRFRRPRPAEAWGGVRDALQLGPMAPSNSLPVAPGANAVAGTSPQPVTNTVSEDCLRINVWTPTLDSARNLPVIVNMPHYAMGSAMGDLRTLAAGGEA